MPNFSSELSGYIKKVLNNEYTPEDLHQSIIYIIEYLSVNINDKGTKVDQDEKLSCYVNISSFLTSLRAKELDIKAEYIAAAASAILKFSQLVNTENLNLNSESSSSSSSSSSSFESNQENEEQIIADIVGTGGDGQNTFNVSTSAAIVVSGIPGIKIVKHGGKASTSNSGAGDLINHLGVESPKVVAKNVEQHLFHKNDFLFLLASQFHNGMFHIAEIRKLMKIPTIFNVLGPLLHPVDIVNRRILGVYSEKLGLEYAKAAQLIYPNSNVMVVYGECGLDELSPIGESKIWKVTPNSKEIEIFKLSPSEFGLKEYPLDQCISKGPAENADFLENQVLAGKFHKGENAIYDYILLNSSLLYCLCTNSTDYEKAVDIVEESIHSGSALKALKQFVSSVKDL